jgi:hypothetical protein
MAIIEYVDRPGEMRPARPGTATPPSTAAEAAAAAAGAPTLQARLAAVLDAQRSFKFTPPAPRAAPAAKSAATPAAETAAATPAAAAGGKPPAGAAAAGKEMR